MEISKHLSKKMEESDNMIKEIERIKEKLVNPDVPDGKKEKLKYICPILKEKLKEKQRSLY